MAEGRNPVPQESGKRGGDDLGRRVAALERTVAQQVAQLAQLQTPPIDCVFCQGTGKQLSGETWVKLDVHNRPIPCPICKGKGKVKV